MRDEEKKLYSRLWLVRATKFCPTVRTKGSVSVNIEWRMRCRIKGRERKPRKISYNTSTKNAQRKVPPSTRVKKERKARKENIARITYIVVIFISSPCIVFPEALPLYL